jgi:hypothetical protein
LLVLAGAFGPGIPAHHLAAELKKVTNDDRIITVTFGTALGYDDCCHRVLKAVEKSYPSCDPVRTSEVDVVAFSMGGLVARLAALPPDCSEKCRKRLHINRLFTISTPHRGSRLAGLLPVPHPLMLGMQPGSQLLKRLDAGLKCADYQIVAYVRSGDFVVGLPNAAPCGGIAWKAPGQGFAENHNAAPKDPRIKADIARRLRGEGPWQPRQRLTTRVEASVQPVSFQDESTGSVELVRAGKTSQSELCDDCGDNGVTSP